MSYHHQYDPMRNPSPFKIYEELDPIPLSLDTPLLDLPALSAIATGVTPIADGQTPDVGMLAKILHLSSGITKTLQHDWGAMQFRAAACTGALYHIELYLVCGDLPGIDAGVYHFDPSESALRRLRKGDYRNTLADATGDEPAVAHAPAILVYSDIFWRNAVKYQAREYRHAFWDSGTIIANSLAAATACNLPAKLVAGFVDESVNRLLDLDVNREVALALVPIGFASEGTAGSPPAFGPLDLRTVPVPDDEIDFPAIREMHEASSLASRDEVVAWRDGSPAITAPSPSGTLVSIETDTRSGSLGDSVETVITRRGSARRFSHESITFPELSTVLAKATQEIAADFLSPQSPALNHIYLIVNAVDGLRPGVYVFHRKMQVLELLRPGDFRGEAGHLGLDQALPADASVDVFFMVDLEPVLERFGNRGYRAAQLEASIMAGRLYLGAYALRLGATGLTFYDDAVTEFFSPHAQGKSAMFLLALGRRSRQK